MKWNVIIEPKIKGSLLLIVTTMLWGYCFVIMKTSLEHVDPLALLCVKFLLAFLFLAIVSSRKWRAKWKSYAKKGVMVGIWLFLASYFQLLGCETITAGKSAFLTTVYVILVPFINRLIFKKAIPGKAYIAGGFALAGIGLLSLDDSLNIGRGEILALIGGLGYAVHMIYVDRYVEDSDPLVLTAWQMLMGFISSFFMSIIRGVDLAAVLNPDLTFGILYLGIIGTGLAFLLQNIGQKYTAPQTASLLLSLESVFGMLCSVLFLSEVMTLKKFSGCFLIFIAIIIDELKIRRKSN